MKSHSPVLEFVYPGMPWSPVHKADDITMCHRASITQNICYDTSSQLIRGKSKQGLLCIAGNWKCILNIILTKFKHE